MDLVSLCPLQPLLCLLSVLCCVFLLSCYSVFVSSVSFVPVSSVRFVPAMNTLSLFNGIHSGLPRQEFIELLSVFPADSLKSLRADLFVEAQDLGLVPHGLPLVDRRDSALRPISKALSDDVWTIVQCINNKECIPRTVLKNGKRSQKFLQSQNSNSSHAVDRAHKATTPLSTNIPVPSTQPSVSRRDHSNATLPSRSKVSDMLISRDINTLKDELRQLKSELSCIRNASTTTTPADSIGQELITLKREMAVLQERVSSLSTASSQVPVSPPPSSVQVSQDPSDTITLTSWNCRGLANAKLYLEHLINAGSDVIILSEHWLWPFNLDQLQNIHPDFVGFGYSDKRLHENSHLSRGCGGVGIIWKYNLQVSPVTKIVSVLSNYNHRVLAKTYISLVFTCQARISQQKSSWSTWPT